MLDSSWSLIPRVLPSLALNVPDWWFCHFPWADSSRAIERSSLRHLAVSYFYSKLAPRMPLVNSDGWCLFRLLQVVVRSLLHHRRHKGGPVSLCVPSETRFEFAVLNKLLAQTCVLKNCGSWWLKLCSLQMWSILPIQAFLRYQPL